ncbi:hypothetical protein AAFF_G00008280 [Aldrovandia affinis]|uniref:Uncharacterized protein n=1 Tax=Aldrovandia affinis TaxID=143900 RepID=A0AAD7T6A7_9TELE|nr:hypothetical protein AAFF_G00008280 [Aldrovandia affinis]
MPGQECSEESACGNEILGPWPGRSNNQRAELRSSAELKQISSPTTIINPAPRGLKVGACCPGGASSPRTLGPRMGHWEDLEPPGAVSHLARHQQPHEVTEDRDRGISGQSLRGYVRCLLSGNLWD